MARALRMYPANSWWSRPLRGGLGGHRDRREEVDVLDASLARDPPRHLGGRFALSAPSCAGRTSSRSRRAGDAAGVPSTPQCHFAVQMERKR